MFRNASAYPRLGWLLFGIAMAGTGVIPLCRQAAIVRIEKSGGSILFDYHESSGIRDLLFYTDEHGHVEAPVRHDSWHSIVEVPCLADAIAMNLKGDCQNVLPLIRWFPTLRRLAIRDAAVSEASLEALSSVGNLEELELVDVGGVSGDAILASASGLKSLELLRVDVPGVTDAGLGRLRGHPSLLTFFFDGTSVTDEGLRELESVPNLVGVVIMYPRPQVSESAVKSFLNSRKSDASVTVNGMIYLYENGIIREWRPFTQSVVPDDSA